MQAQTHRSIGLVCSDTLLILAAQLATEILAAVMWDCTYVQLHTVQYAAISPRLGTRGPMYYTYASCSYVRCTAVVGCRVGIQLILFCLSIAVAVRFTLFCTDYSCSRGLSPPPSPSVCTESPMTASSTCTHVRIRLDLRCHTSLGLAGHPVTS